jgi:hypothetical protein
VRSDALSFACQSAIYESLFFPQILEACHDVGLKTVPFEADLLASHHRRQNNSRGREELTKKGQNLCDFVHFTSKTS